MRLVDDAHEWKRWWSMRWIIVSTFCSAVAVAYATLPTDWLPAVPNWVKGALAGGAMLAGGAAAVSRVVAQAPKDPPRPSEPTDQRLPPA